MLKHIIGHETSAIVWPVFMLTPAEITNPCQRSRSLPRRYSAALVARGEPSVSFPMCSIFRTTVLLQRNPLAQVPRLSRFPPACRGLPVASGPRSTLGTPGAAPHPTNRRDRSNALLSTPFDPSRRRIGPSEVVFASRSAPLRFLVAPNHSLLCRVPALSPPFAAVRAAWISLVLPVTTLCAHGQRTAA